MISLYFHIPFCTRKCDYCHFFVLPDKEPLKQQLMEGFRLEWQLRKALVEKFQVQTVYFGGGTPALLGPERISEILSWLTLSPETEVTLEANPENMSLSLMQAYAKAGINRVSIGLQSLDDSLLRILGRVHNSTKALDSVYVAAEAGIENISVDLMYDLPGQSKNHWEQTLKNVGKLPIKHLSLYNLTIEPHTVFFKKRDQLTKQIPNPEESLWMYQSAIQTLEERGLQQYEISAFAHSGYASKHNIGYWTARPFLGFGPSAYSYWEGSRFRNIAHLGKYTTLLQEGKYPTDFEEKLDPAASSRELLAIRLRLMEGVEKKAIPHVEGLQETLQRLTKEGFLEEKNERLFLTKRGILFYDTVAVEII